MTDSPDPIMDAITEAIAVGRAGETDAARRGLLELWPGLDGIDTAVHRCVLGHFLADLYPHPARALAWDIRALDAAEAATRRREADPAAAERVADWYPSLHLNLADNYRRLGSLDAAAEHIEAAQQCASVLPQGDYGDLIRSGITWTAAALGRGDTGKMPPTPGERTAQSGDDVHP